jgi:antitoxin HigA-1
MPISREDLLAGRIDLKSVTTGKKIPPVHPGQMLGREFLKPLRITQYRLAKATGLPLTRINTILAGHRSITADTALRLGRFFGMDPQFWLNLQARYDLRKAERKAQGSMKNIKTLAEIQISAQ